ncbi:MAG: BrnA antitoxin family protein [Chloroflexi bacterium]|nr:MAG: BrnA antitoxin family protein [Chloroflexota bacterium]
MKKEYDFSGGVRGPVLRVPPGKTRITIRIDDDVLRWFRTQVHAAGGGNYQTLLNAALREHIERRDNGLEDTLRLVIREELGRYRVKTPGAGAVRASKRRTRHGQTGPRR